MALDAARGMECKWQYSAAPASIGIKGHGWDCIPLLLLLLLLLLLVCVLSLLPQSCTTAAPPSFTATSNH